MDIVFYYLPLSILFFINIQYHRNSINTLQYRNVRYNNNYSRVNWTSKGNFWYIRQVTSCQGKKGPTLNWYYKSFKCYTLCVLAIAVSSSKVLNGISVQGQKKSIHSHIITHSSVLPIVGSVSSLVDLPIIIRTC